MEVHYCKSWFLADKRPSEVWSEAQARKAHQQGTLYSVIVGKLEQPMCILEVTAFRCVNVYFLDRLKRAYSSYQYIENSPGQLFLSHGSYRTYEGDSDKIIAAEGYYFYKNGSVTVRKFNYELDERSEISYEFDVRHNWEPYPEFGDFAGLARCERQVLSDGGNFRCLCCDYKTLQREPPGTFESCPVCGWIDEPLTPDPNDSRPKNDVTLEQARVNYLASDTCSKSVAEIVRKPLPQEL